MDKYLFEHGAKNEATNSSQVSFAHYFTNNTVLNNAIKIIKASVFRVGFHDTDKGTVNCLVPNEKD